MGVELVVGSERIGRIAMTNVNRLVDSKLYRGIRHVTFRPVRGQRSRTNANTQRVKGIRPLILSNNNDNIEDKQD